MEVTIRTMNWNRLDFYRKTKAPAHLEPRARKVDTLTKLIKRYEDKLRSQNVCVGARRWGKTTMHSHFVYTIVSQYHSLTQLKFAISTGNRAQIKRVINDRINHRASS